MTSLNVSIIYPTNYREVLTLAEISEAVMNYFNVPDLGAKSQKRKVAYPRHVYCYLSRMYTSASWKEIAEHVGGRDHTTAIHSVHTLKNWMETDTDVKNDVSNIKAIINEKRNYAIFERRKIA